ncbi:MmcQ/YjbR family DNA-binding protein [Paenibacillus flagellatus]|uniref:MmcQ-like protein n=1 Tax=Paenibacillus flagellatus TaxID=2211139 RepID=A0A2V5KAA3_9BACL|nr:MmcQ/YjbR family DNA-binding protein [Paenibacillus flagellatus]PYI56525.1 MmcQ-like protein [Paenibacillus flagellatus]
MNREELVAYALSKKGAREDYPFGPEPLVLKVGTKMFALIAEDAGGRPAISLKCEPETAYLLRQQYEAVKPGYHLNKQHWNTVTIDGTVPDGDIRGMIDESYALVARKLTRAEKEQLGLELRA